MASGQDGQRVGADLVRHVSVGGDPVGPHDDPVDRARAPSGSRPPSPSPRGGGCPPARAPTPSGGRPAGAGASRRPTPAPGGRAPRRRAARRPRCRAARGERAGVAVRERAVAGLEALGAELGQPPVGLVLLGGCARGERERIAVAAASARSSAQPRLTAVGRVARSSVGGRRRSRRGRPSAIAVCGSDADRRGAAHREGADAVGHLREATRSGSSAPRPAGRAGRARAGRRPPSGAARRSSRADAYVGVEPSPQALVEKLELALRAERARLERGLDRDPVDERDRAPPPRTRVDCLVDEALTLRRPSSVFAIARADRR